jgi:WhiB family transcriptional regulator, redox-sensing transcriptional regulator
MYSGYSQPQYEGRRVEEGHMHELYVIDGMLDDGEAEEGALSWQERSLCAQTDPEAFFPEKGGSTREAKKVCVGCEVRSECLEYALANDERFGIWGGLSERERRKLKKRAV